MRSLAVFITLFLALSGLARAQTDSMPVSMGINVDGVADYAPESYFVDAMKQSRHWGSVATPWDLTASVDSNGWPTQDAGIIVLCCINDASGHSLLAGSYALSFKGQADVGLEIWHGSVTGMSYDAASNTSTATVTLLDDGSGGVSLYLSFTNTRRSATAALGSGVTNVVLLRPQIAPNGQAWWTTPGQIFTTPYLALISNYSTLRFMDFEATNGNTTQLWGQRTLATDATQQTPNGVAWEYVVAMANAVHKDIWVNIPEAANDAYVQALATLLHNTLAPGINVYTEYSNEVWNYSFPQFYTNQAAAEATVAADPSSPLALGCADYNSCRYQWGARRVGQRAVQIGQIFRSVFGADAARVRPIYATQEGQTYYVSLVMSMLSAAYGKPSTLLYGIAQAPYFAGDNTVDGLNAGQELKQAALALVGAGQAEHGFAAYGALYGLRSVTYEGGPGMTSTPSLAAKIAANRSPGMGALVARGLRQAFANGISLYMYFNDCGDYGQYGMWGTTENVFDLATPKIQAIQAVQNDGAEPLATGHTTPSDFPAPQADITNGGYTVSDGSYAYIGNGASYSYLINVPATGSYALSLRSANYYGATQGMFRIDQAVAGKFTVPAGTGPGDWVLTSRVIVTLAAGLHTLTVVAPNAGFAMQTVNVRAN